MRLMGLEGVITMSDIPKGWSYTALLGGYPSPQTLTPLAWFEPTLQRSGDQRDDKRSYQLYGAGVDAFPVEAHFL